MNRMGAEPSGSSRIAMFDKTGDAKATQEVEQLLSSGEQIKC